MTPDEIVLVGALAGLALAITLVDLLLSAVRHRRTVRGRSLQRLGSSENDEAIAAARSRRIMRRLSAIEDASADPTPPASPVS